MTKLKAKLDAAQILSLIDDPEVTFVQFRLRKEATIKELIKALRFSSESRQRAVLCYVLGRRYARSAVVVLIGCLKDPSENVRSEAAQSLDKLENPIAGEPLYNAFLLETKPGAKSSMALALGGVKYRPAVPALIEALSDCDQRVRNMAAWSLGYIGDRQAISALQRALEIETDAHAKTLMWEAIDDLSNQDQ